VTRLGKYQFEVGEGEGLDLVEELYTNVISETDKGKIKPKFNQQDGFVQDIQKELLGSVSAVN